jgi:hypothetical protein
LERLVPWAWTSSAGIVLRHLIPRGFRPAL